MARLAVDHPSERQNSGTKHKFKFAHMRLSGPQSGALNINSSFLRKTGGLRMEQRIFRLTTLIHLCDLYSSSGMYRNCMYW